jgi:hypothetical protein
MSVPAWARKLARTQYLYETFKFNIRIGQIVMGKPKKYRDNYGDRVITSALDALKFCQAANSIYMSEHTSEKDYHKRRSYLMNAVALIDNVSTTADIFLALNYDVDGAKRDQLDRQEEYIGKTCRQIHLLICGVIDSDAKVFSGQKQPKTPSHPPKTTQRRY